MLLLEIKNRAGVFLQLYIYTEISAIIKPCWWGFWFPRRAVISMNFLLLSHRVYKKPKEKEVGATQTAQFENYRPPCPPRLNIENEMSIWRCTLTYIHAVVVHKNMINMTESHTQYGALHVLCTVCIQQCLNVNEICKLQMDIQICIHCIYISEIPTGFRH